MRLPVRFTLTLALAFAAACSGNATTDGGSDAADGFVPVDVGLADAAPDNTADVGSTDAGADVVDVSSPDAGQDVVVADDVTPDVIDVVTPSDVVNDTGTVDSGSVDTGVDARVDAGVDTGVDVVSDVAVDSPVDAGPPVAFGAPCTALTVCAAPAGETGICGDSFVQPFCSHTCDSLPDYALCEGTSGICVPSATHKYCFQKCGDVEGATCSANQACEFVGYRDHTATDAGYTPVGLCIPNCTTTGPGACSITGYACDNAARTCGLVGCAGGCPVGSTCSGATCVPNTPIALYGSCTATAPGISNGCSANLCYSAGMSVGFCSARCTPATAAATCGAGGVCWTDFAQEAFAPDGGTISLPVDPFASVGGATAGICLRSCAVSTDCPTGSTCADTGGSRACVPDFNPRGGTAAAGTVLAGDLCRASADCASGTCGLATGYVDGFCFRNAAATCPATTDQSPTTTLECDRTCLATTWNPCAGSLVCDDSTHHCVIGICRDNLDCTAGSTCDVPSARCVTTASTGSAIGTACAVGTACAGGVCLTTGTPTFPGGYCSANCTVLPDFSDTCPSGSVCSSGTPGHAGACLDLCDFTGAAHFGACRAGYRCLQLSNGAAGYCTP